MSGLRPAEPSELDELTELCIRSKAHWGYDPAFMSACREELTLTPDDLVSASTWVIEAEGMPVAVAQVFFDGGTAELHNFFVDPDHMGQGLGRRLFDWAVSEARRLGATSMRIESDPHARPFYERMGARLIGETPSESIPGRMLPLLELDLTR